MGYPLKAETNGADGAKMYKQLKKLKIVMELLLQLIKM